MYATSAQATSPEDVLSFWFPGDLADASLQVRERRWFGRNAAFDAAVVARFGRDIRAASAGGLDDWGSTARGRLALIIVMDQFTRNAFRNSPAAYDLDARAVELCIEGLAKGLDRALSPIERMFFYLPLLHSERLVDQEIGVECFRQLLTGLTDRQVSYFRRWLQVARRHRRIIAWFGRFPHRNLILRRRTTPMECLFLLRRQLQAAARGTRLTWWRSG